MRGTQPTLADSMTQNGTLVEPAASRLNPKGVYYLVTKKTKEHPRMFLAVHGWTKDSHACRFFDTREAAERVASDFFPRSGMAIGFMIPGRLSSLKETDA